MATYNVTPETNKIIKEYAEQISVPAEEALNKLILTADSRRKALARYAKSPGSAPRQKAKPAPKAEPKAKPAPKAKGPIGRKAAAGKPRKAAKEPKASPIATVSGEEAAPV